MARMGWIFAGLALLAATSAPAADVSGYFKSGTYAVSVYVNNTSGANCLDSAGQTYAGVLNYAGIGANRAGLRIPLSALGLVSFQSLTATQGVGSQSPSGTFTWTAAGLPASGWNLSGTWSANIFPSDLNSFVVTIVEAYSGCSSERLTLSATRTGPHQS